VNVREERITAPLPPAAILAALNADRLIREIELYLRAVALFRRLGCEPTWKAGT
jgi:hypothetical protein